MSEPELTDLLHDRVAGVTGRDLTDGAWRRGRAVRRRRAAAIVGGTVAATAIAAVGVGVAVGDDEAGPAPLAPPGPSSAPTTEATDPVTDPVAPGATRPDARLDDGSPVYWAPTPDAEGSLPSMTRHRPDLPGEIDLGTDAPDAETDPLPRAEAAFAVVGDTTRLLLVDGDRYRSLDLSAVEPSPSVSNPAAPPAVGAAMLSPGGGYLQFPQGDHVLVFDVADGAWRRIETGDLDTSGSGWLGSSVLVPRGPGDAGPTFDPETGERDGAARLPTAAASLGVDLGPSPTPYGRDRDGAHGPAQTWTTDVPVEGPEAVEVDPDVLVAPVADGSDVLLFGDRAARCCPVASWAAEDVLVYESAGDARRLVAWQVGTHTFSLLAQITGVAPDETVIGSYARWWLRPDEG